jgi:hypothetical protein
LDQVATREARNLGVRWKETSRGSSPGTRSDPRARRGSEPLLPDPKPGGPPRPTVQHLAGAGHACPAMLLCRHRRPSAPPPKGGPRVRPRAKPRRFAVRKGLENSKPTTGALPARSRRPEGRSPGAVPQQSEGAVLARVSRPDLPLFSNNLTPTRAMPSSFPYRPRLTNQLSQPHFGHHELTAEHTPSEEANPPTRSRLVPSSCSGAIGSALEPWWPV